jgi:DNA-binding NarL/FixJ family response regulator
MNAASRFDPGKTGVPSRRSALVIDASRLFAEAMTRLLEDLGFDVSVATTPDGVAPTSDVTFDLVLVDMSMPRDAGMAIGKRFIASAPGTVVMGITAGSDQRKVRECRRAGFHGCVSKDTPVSRFTRLVRRALQGQPIVTGIETAPAGGPTRRTDIELLSFQLTNRELEILSMLVEGANGREIAQRCRISPNTVRTHVQSVLTKLQVHSRLEAAALAVRYGLVAPSRRESGAA